MPKELGIEPNIIRAKWDKYGLKAGYIRNPVIVENAQRIIAFWDIWNPKSKGTRDTIDIAMHTPGKEVWVYHANNYGVIGPIYGIGGK